MTYPKVIHRDRMQFLSYSEIHPGLAAGRSGCFFTHTGEHIFDYGCNLYIDVVEYIL